MTIRVGVAARASFGLFHRLTAENYRSAVVGLLSMVICKGLYILKLELSPLKECEFLFVLTLFGIAWFIHRTERIKIYVMAVHP